MDKSTTTGYILILLLFIGFFYFTEQNNAELEKQNATASADSIVNNQPDSSIADAFAVNDLAVRDTTDSVETIAVIEESIKTLENDKLKIDFTNKGGIPKKVEILEYTRYDSSDLVLFENNQSQYGYTIPLANGTSINTLGLDFQLEKSEANSLVYSATLPGNAKITQTYTLEEESYKLNYDVRFTGFDKVIAPNNRYAEVVWKVRLQPQEKSVEDEQSATTVYYNYASEDDVDYLSETSDEDEETLQGNIKWISFKQKFFNQTLISDRSIEEDGIKIKIEKSKDEKFLKDAYAEFYLPIDHDVVEENFNMFYGPNHYQTLKKEGIHLQKMIPLGWGVRWVNMLVIIPVFNWLDQYFDSYGVIILLLTLIIKAALFFPMYKVYKSSAKMKLLKPELDEIKEKSGGDMQKQQQEQMKLYKQAGVSPLGGCLPQLVQMPILFAMFRFFPASIELRQEKLWWADDLSTYDSIYTFPNGFEIPFYGDHISLFTLMMTAVTLFYTYMNSQASGQMVGPMKTVMYIMPIMFLGFFNNYAAALSFYYFLSTCITIIQNFVIRKFVIDEDKLHKQIQESKKKKVKIKKSGLQKRLEDMAKKRGVDPYTGKAKGRKPKK